MILDNCAERTVISDMAARRLGLTVDRWVDTTLGDAGGRLVTHPNADVSAATLGGLPLTQRPGMRSLSLSVAGTDLGGADGLVGGDLLRHFTFGLDVPRARLSLSLAQVVRRSLVVPICGCFGPISSWRR